MTDQTFQHTTSPYPQISQYSPPQASIQYQIRPPQPQFPLQAPSLNLDSLHRDIEVLIARTKEDFVRDISNAELQTRLKALVDLQSVLRNQQLPPEALQAVRNQVRDLQMSQRPQMQAPTSLPVQNPVQNPMQSAFPGHPPIPYSTPVQAQYAPPPQIVQTQPTPEPANQQPPSTATLASLLASVQRNTQSQPSGLPQSSSSIPTPQPPAPVQSGPSENSLLAQLRAAGLLNANANGNTNVASTPPVSIAPPPSLDSQPLNLSDLLRKVVAKPSKQSSTDHVELTSASLKM